MLSKMPATPLRIAILLVGGVGLVACGIAETKLPPDPTVEYLPCSGVTLQPSGRVDPLIALDLSPELEKTLWGGVWTVGEEWHIGITDVGAVDWQAACPEVGDSGLVVHEVPFPLGDLETWSETVDGQIAALGDPGSASQQMVVQSGQYLIEIRAGSVEVASALTESIPLEAWVYGGQVPSGSG